MSRNNTFITANQNESVIPFDGMMSHISKRSSFNTINEEMLNKTIKDMNK